MRKQPPALKSTHTLRTRTLGLGLQWKIVCHFMKCNCILLAYCIKDKVGNDSSCGIFSIFDGHGGRQVADHCAERVAEELRKDIMKT